MEKLTAAVNNWLHKTGPHLGSDPKMSLKYYAARCEVPFNTLRKFVCNDENKRRKLGACAGKAKLVNADAERFTVDMIRIRDRGNDGMSRSQVRHLQPAHTHTQLHWPVDSVNARNIARQH